MSSEKEIQEVYEQEIREKSQLVEKKFGKLVFYERGKGMREFHMTDPDPCRTKYQGEK